MGIEYSTPVAAQKRWRLSKVLDSFPIVAGSIGPIAPQIPFVSPVDGSTLLKFKQHENCLNLNIYAAVGEKEKPVMVWIHGGGFQGGSASLPEYDARKLASAGNVVVVSINYRLGCLGFLRLCDLSDGMITSTGNEGLGDQITALNWIQDNIHYFGGDKHNVTVFGESAGAMSIACLLASPAAKGLFHKAILQSGAGHTYSSIEKANQVAAEFINSANLLGFSMDELPSLSTSDLLDVQAHFLSRPEVYQQFGVLPFTPVIENKLLPLPPHEAISNGSAKNVILMAGTNTDEWTFFAAILRQKISTKEELVAALSPLFPAGMQDHFIEWANQQRSCRTKPKTLQQLLNTIHTEFWFAEPCHRILKSQLDAGGVAYRYKLGRRSPMEQFGCTHVADIGYVFAQTNTEFHGDEPRVNHLVDEIQRYWTRIAKFGSPTDLEGIWPTYGNDFAMMFFDHDASYLAHHDQATVNTWSGVSNQKLASF